MFLTILIVLLSADAGEITGLLPCLVVDKRTDLPVADVQVCVTELSVCVQSDSTGRCTFQELPPDIYSIKAFTLGGDTLLLPNIAITSGVNNLLYIAIDHRAVYQLDSMIVRTNRLSQKKIEQTTSIARLSTFDLSNIAGTGNDVNRVLETFPSVISIGAEFDNTLFVRGGHSRENVYLIDGIEIDNISHFSDVSGSGGAIGYVNGSVVDYLDFYAGAIPCSFPPRTSSVIDIHLRNGSLTDRKYQFDLNMSGLGLHTEGPLPKQSGAYLANIRYSDLRFLKDLVGVSGIPRFGDSHTRLAFFLNENNTLHLTNIFGFDAYKEEDDLEGWQFPTDWTETLFQSGTGLSWETKTDRFRNRVLGSFTLRNEEYFEELSNFSGPFTAYEARQKLNMTSPDDTVVTGSDTIIAIREMYLRREMSGTIDDRWHISLKDDFVRYIRDEDQLELGITGTRNSYHLAERNGLFSQRALYWFPDTSTMTVMDSIVYVDTPFTVDSTVFNDHVGCYGQYIFKQGPCKVLAGVRADYWRLLRDYGISPRFGFTCDIPRAGTFGISGGLYYQLPANLSRHLYDLMVPNPNYSYVQPAFWEIELQRNWQLVVGYERQFSKSHFLTFELYYKWYDREYTLLDPNTYLFETAYYEAQQQGLPWQFPKPDGRKKAYGLELSFQKKQQKGLYYTLGYSLFSVKNQYADKKWYNDRNNLRNSFAATVGLNFLKHNTISLRLSSAEGRPYSKGIVDSSGWMSYDTTAGYFTKRLDPICSLNLRYSFKLARRWGNITGYIEIWNLLNYTPVVERYLGYMNYRDHRSNGIIPVAGFTVDF